RSLSDVQSMAGREDKAARVQEMQTAFQAYAEAIVPALELVDQRVELVEEVLHPASDGMVEWAVAQRDSAAEAGEMDLVIGNTDLSRAMLQARIYTDRYLLTNGEDEFNAIWESLFEGIDAMDALDNPEAIEDLYIAFEDGLNDLSGVVGEISAIEEELHSLGMLITDAATELKLGAMANQGEIRSAASAELVGARSIMVWASVGIVFFGIVAAVWIGHSITGPIDGMTTALNRLADGDSETDIPHVGRGDEIGAMAHAAQIFKDSAHRMAAMQLEQEESRRKAEEEQKILIAKLADELEQSVSGVIAVIGDSTQQLESTAQNMQANAQSTLDQVRGVATITGETRTDVQSAAAGTEDLTVSIDHISQQVSDSSAIAKDAVTKAGQAATQVEALREAAGRIGEVVSLISDIAEQTNLLALNATIEAARAGEAGKGFAVVANEVKHLANQTGRATEEISTQIGDVQNATQEAVNAIAAIGEVIHQVDDISASVAEAVNTQGDATRRIADAAQRAATGTEQCSESIETVTSVAGETEVAAGRVMESSRSLSEQSESLKEQVWRFLRHIRSSSQRV
ncbi:MAG: methyl-accepting chemotaxis protein, partial [Rhodospirillaceae bacterium]